MLNISINKITLFSLTTLEMLDKNNKKLSIEKLIRTLMILMNHNEEKLNR